MYIAVSERLRSDWTSCLFVCSLYRQIRWEQFQVIPYEYKENALYLPPPPKQIPLDTWFSQVVPLAMYVIPKYNLLGM